MVSITQSLLFIAFFLVLLSSVFITSFFKFTNIVPYLFCIYLFSFAHVIIAAELAGLLNLLNNRFFFLFFHLTILISAFISWRHKGSPSIFSPLISFSNFIKKTKPGEFFKKNKLLLIIGLGVSAQYVFNLVLVLKVAPNNYDALTGHIARIGYWLQQGNFKPWPTWFTVQTEYPINAQIQILWSILFWRTDTFAGMTQWIASIIAILAIYGVSRTMSRSRNQSLFAAFICALFPIILLESTTVQPHLCGAALVLCAFYFLFLGYTNKNKGSLLLSGLAFGMALGVHGIFIFMIPGFGLTIIFLGIVNKNFRKTLFRVEFLSLIISFLLLSSFTYIQNTIYTQTPFGSYEKGNKWSPENSNSINQAESYWLPQNLLKYSFFNINKYIFASYDLTGIQDSISEPLYKLREKIFIPIFSLFKIPMHQGEFNINVHVPAVSENWAWFGMVGFVLFYPLIIIESIKAIKYKDPFRTILIFNIFLYTFIWAGILAREDGWHMYSSRYFIPCGLLFAPLIASVYQKRFCNKIFSLLLIISSLLIAYNTTNNNYAKPLYNNGSVFKWTRLEQMYVVSWDQLHVIQAVEEQVPSDATLGLLFTANTIEYPFFGQYFKRTLVPIFPYDKINDEKWLINQKITWILSCVDSADSPKEFTEIESIPLNSPVVDSSGCHLYKR